MSDEVQSTAYTQAVHPLDMLTQAEISKASEILKGDNQYRKTMRFVSLTLNEPLKADVLAFQEGDELNREAFIVLIDRADGKAYEVIVSISEGLIRSWTYLEGIHPSVTAEEFEECQTLVRSHPEVHEALRKRGIENFDLVEFEVWPPGHYGETEETERRIVRVLVFTHMQPDDNHFAHPIDNLIVVVDLNTMELIRVEDYGVVPVPQNPGDYAEKYIDKFRDDIKPLDIVQPEGVSFTIKGQEVQWQKWRFRVGFTLREGLVLHQISYEDDGRERPIIYRASLAELTVPYGDPSPTQFRKNAFDVGEFGVGLGTNSLELGCDCLGEIYYFDAFLCDGDGNPQAIKNAICLHEEDQGILWKHHDGRTGVTEVRRSRRLVVSFITTVGNYEYAFYWYFYQDGSMALDIKMTGILQTGALPSGETTPFGIMLDEGLYAPHHQHMFCIRMDMSIDGQENTVVEVDTVSQPMGPDNPYGNAFYPQYTPLRTELEGQRVINPSVARYWQIQNDQSLNKISKPVAYKLVPGGNPFPFARPGSSIAKRGAYMWKHLWVTPYNPREMHPSGDYPNQHQGDDGLPIWTQEDRNIENTDVVVWYVLGAHHIARLEDWPVMPVEILNFALKPSGFFDKNPALDVPPSEDHHCHM